MSDILTATDCAIIASWGSAWGSGWGGTPLFDEGGPVPTFGPYDLFCFCGAAMAFLTAFTGVTGPGDVDHGFVDSLTGGYVVQSNDAAEAEVFVDVAVPTSNTLDVVFRADQLPPDFQTSSHRLFFGCYDDTLFCTGIFVSQLGLAFGGAPNDQPLYLVDSSGLVTPGEVYVLRLVLSPDQEVVYVYWSTLSEAQTHGGPVLRYQLPLLASQDVPSHQEGVYVSALGSASHPVRAVLLSMCLSSALLVANVPPQADAGPTQTVPLCSVVRLDGTRSTDLEGAPLLYFWRLLDAPTASTHVDEGQDGETLAAMDGFVSKLYSIHAAASGDDSFAFSAGDILLFAGVGYVLVSRGTDVDGDYFLVEGDVLPASLTGQSFRIVRQDGFLDNEIAEATFLPDKAGLYRFQLKVSDGALWSESSETLVNVKAINQPRGVVPDSAFLWDYMSDVTRLIEDGERIEIVYAGILQILGAELLHAWQVDASKSLKTIPRSVARRWLNYDLLQREPFGYLSSVRYVGKGVRSAPLAGSGLSLAGSKLVLSLPYRAELVEVTLTASQTTPAQVADHLRSQLRLIDSRFGVELLRAGGAYRKVCLSAPFPFTVVAGSWSAWTVGATNGPLEGVTVTKLSAFVVELDADLRGLPLQAGDLVVFKTDTGLFTLRYGSLLPPETEPTSPPEGDPLRPSRIQLLDALPPLLEGSWVFALQAISPQLDFWAGLVHNGDPCVLELADAALGEISHLRAPTLGVNEGRANVLALYPDETLLPPLAAPARFTWQFWGVYRRTALPVDSLVERVPFLQREVHPTSEEEVLRENVDFRVGTSRGLPALLFESHVWTGAPLARLWAEYTYLSNEPVIEANFGEAVGLRSENFRELTGNQDYLSAVRGLWYAYFRGPRVANLRVGAQVLLGLPFAEEPGEILRLEPQYSTQYGRVVVQDLAEPRPVRSYLYPRALPVETNPLTSRPYEEGDRVAQFAPLVRGVEVVDYVNDPRWILPYLNQGLLKETDRFHSFLVRISLEAFSLASTLFIQDFLRRIGPLRTKPLFLVRKEIPQSDTVDVTDELGTFLWLMFSDTPYQAMPHDLDTGDPDTRKRIALAAMFDQTHPSPGYPAPSAPWSGHIKGVLDRDIDPENADPVFPDADAPMGAMQDQGNIRPETLLTARVQLAHSGLLADMPLFEELAEADQPALEPDKYLVFGQQWIPTISAAGLALRGPQTPATAYTIDYAQVTFVGTPPAATFEYVVEIYKNGVLQVSLSLVHDAEYNRYELGPAPALAPLGASIAVTGADTVQVLLAAAGADPATYVLKAATVVVGAGVSWDAGGPALPAGTYEVVRTL